MTTNNLKRIAVVNRGEPAVRFMRALREYNLERGTQIRSVAIFTHPDEGAPFVRMADEAARIGAAMVAGKDGAMISAYLDHDRIIEALRRHGCDAVWPGWGFVSEDPTFVERLEAEGIVFLGPSSSAMRALGDKIASKQLAESYDVPVAPWFIVDDLDDAAIVVEAQRVGYPLMVKASAGGGGRGIRRVNEAASLLNAIGAVKDEVRKIFGQGGVFIEAAVTSARHIEVQLMVGVDGVACALGVRDCSIQRRNQKVIEEAPSPVATAAAVARMCAAAVRLAEGVGYRGAGTAEFLYAPADDSVFFLEVNSRLQVEHTVTEMTSGADLVKSQIDIARGLPWERPSDPARGCAIEVRLNAENPAKGFAPAPGLVRVFQPPAGPGLRVDSGVVEGMVIAPEFDSMIAKLIAWGRTRSEAIARLKRALQEFPVVVENGCTNKAFLLDLLSAQPFVDGSADTAWLDRAMAAGEIGGSRNGAEALLAAAVLRYRQLRVGLVGHFIAQSQNGIPQNLPAPQGIEVHLRLGGDKVTLAVMEIGRDRYLVGPPGQLREVTFRALSAHTGTMQLAGVRHDLLYSLGSAGIYVEVDGAGHELEEVGGGVVKASVPAMVVAVFVQAGDVIAAGDKLATLEAMKMEMPLYAHESGVVGEVLCRANMQVRPGQPLMVIEASAETGKSDNGGSRYFAEAAAPWALAPLFDDVGRPDILRLDGLSDPAAAKVVEAMERMLRNAMLGYDLPEVLTRPLYMLFKQDQHFAKLQRPERLRPLSGALAAFVAVESLFDRNLLPMEGEPVAVSAQISFFDFCRNHGLGDAAVPPPIDGPLRAALALFKVTSCEPSEELREALWRLATAHAHPTLRHQICSSILRGLIGTNLAGLDFRDVTGLQRTIDQVAALARVEHRAVSDTARQASFELFGRHRFVRRDRDVARLVDDALAELLDADRDSDVARGQVTRLLTARQSLLHHLAVCTAPDSPSRSLATEVLIKRFHQHLEPAPARLHAGHGVEVVDFVPGDASDVRRVVAVGTTLATLDAAMDALAAVIGADGAATGGELVFAEPIDEARVSADIVPAVVASALRHSQGLRLTLTFTDDTLIARHRTLRNDGVTFAEVALLRDIHPEAAKRIELWRLSEFELQRLASHEQLFVFQGQARTNPGDERLFVFAEVRDAPETAEAGEARDAHLLDFEQAYFEGIRVIREAQAKRDPRSRYHWNRMAFYVRPPFLGGEKAMVQIAHRLEAPTRGLGLQKVVVRARVPAPGGGLRATDIIMSNPSRNQLEVAFRPPQRSPIRALNAYELKVVRARRLGLVYPYEIVRMLEGRGAEHSDADTPWLDGRFEEYDLDPTSPERLVSVGGRAPGDNRAAVVVGIMRNATVKHPEGIERVWIASDPTMAMGALAEPECRRVIAALDLAQARNVPVEWIPISSGARIAMDSGTENLDWTARVLRRIVHFTQLGFEINVIVDGVNVGAQSYWNAEATMLHHCRGVLIMTPAGSMVLTGKKALEYSGSVAAEDERGIGGFDRIMGVNGQAQYFARDLGHAYRLLFEHYHYTYRAPGEPAVRNLRSVDPVERSVLTSPYTPAADEQFATIGEIFDPATNPDRKRPFAIREVMRAVIDTDGGSLERWQAMRHAETAVVWDAHIGGVACTVIGFESRPQARRGRIPMDGPDAWTGGTLFPQSSKKVARALNAASGNRPVVVLANLSGFDGSPESLRKLQLEHGAEIGRAVINFAGTIVFVVIGRYHGGAYVVFSKALNPNLQALALEHTFASVIGGAPAAAVVFPAEVRRRVAADSRVVAARAALQAAPAAEKPTLRDRLDRLQHELTLEKQGELAGEFDRIHTVHRATEVGSLDGVIAPAALRPAIAARIAAAGVGLR